MSPVSVIIPVGPTETRWPDFIEQLKLPAGSQIILCCGEGHSLPKLPAAPKGIELSRCVGAFGRAGLMNAGAAQANHKWLWFLHADSQLMDDTLPAMLQVIEQDQQGLFFFDLVFAQDGPISMKLNQWGVGVRAGWLKIPFGDQGFLIRKDLFNKLGGYREDLAYGEDHVFVWKVRQAGFAVRRARAGLVTSARKYQRGGWAKVTALHVWLTLRQAIPNWLLLQVRRIERLFT